MRNVLLFHHDVSILTCVSQWIEEENLVNNTDDVKTMMQLYNGLGTHDGELTNFQWVSSSSHLHS
jgi:hypothetical protein